VPLFVREVLVPRSVMGGTGIASSLREEWLRRAAFQETTRSLATGLVRLPTNFDINYLYKTPRSPIDPVQISPLVIACRILCHVLGMISKNKNKSKSSERGERMPRYFQRAENLGFGVRVESYWPGVPGPPSAWVASLIG
jgi:hypothetical protein